MQSASNITNSNEYDDVVDKVTIIDSNISTLQSYTVSKGTNFGIGPDVLQDLTTGTQNTATGYLAGGGPYGLQNGKRNVMVGYISGGTCISGSNNTFLGANTALAPVQIYLSGSIAPGEGVIMSDYNQLMVASNVTSFNISGLAASGDSTGTILECHSRGNIIPSAGTYNKVSKIDSEFSSLSSSVSTNTLNISSLQSQVSTNTTDIAKLQNSVSLTGLFVPTFSSESNCTATATNSGYIVIMDKDFLTVICCFL